MVYERPRHQSVVWGVSRLKLYVAAAAAAAAALVMEVLLLRLLLLLGVY